jgi:cytochrome c peroxidase
MTEFDPRRGLKGADCFHCHGGALFTDQRFHNNGLKDEKDLGLGAITKKGSDRNRFITPSLRNIALSAPYMHDGRFQSLDQVIDHYDSGLHRSPTLDPNLAKHPRGGLGLSKEDKAALLAFLKTLTDPQFRDGETTGPQAAEEEP